MFAILLNSATENKLELFISPGGLWLWASILSVLTIWLSLRIREVNLEVLSNTYSAHHLATLSNKDIWPIDSNPLARDPLLLSLIIPNNVQWADAGASLLVILWSHLLTHSGEGSKDGASLAQPESFYANLQRQPHLHRAQPSLAKRHHEMRNLGSRFSLTQRSGTTRVGD